MVLPAGRLEHLVAQMAQAGAEQLRSVQQCFLTLLHPLLKLLVLLSVGVSVLRAGRCLNRGWNAVGQCYFLLLERALVASVQLVNTPAFILHVGRGFKLNEVLFVAIVVPVVLKATIVRLLLVAHHLIVCGAASQALVPQVVVRQVLILHCYLLASLLQLLLLATLSSRRCRQLLLYSRWIGLVSKTR